MTDWVTISAEDYRKLIAYVNLDERGELVRIVRCKDCVHYDKGENDSEAWEYCKVLAKDVFDDFFCKLGKRRGNYGD